MKIDPLIHNVSRSLAMFSVSALCVGALHAQTVYKCPDANGRLSLSDTPCAGGTQQQVKPDTGHSTNKIEKQTTPTPKEELDNLRTNVNTSAAAREYRDANFNIAKLQARLDNWPSERDEYIRKNKRFTKCGADGKSLCEDYEHTSRLSSEMSTLHNQLITTRSNEYDARSAARKRYFELTKKWLD
jgi:Domain of unknown function (DUF4124)